MDVVAYVRVLTNDGRAGNCEADAAKLTVRVLDVVKPGRVENGTLTFWQELWYEEPTPYRVGTHLFVFLKRWKDRYVRAHGPLVVFPVADGKVQPSKFLFDDRYVGWSDRAFLEKLRESQRR